MPNPSEIERLDAERPETDDSPPVAKPVVCWRQARGMNACAPTDPPAPPGQETLPCNWTPSSGSS